MPYWFDTEKLKVGRERDRRIKIDDEEKERIRALHREGLSIRGIARLYKDKCSRRLIQYIIYPERAKKQYQLRKQRIKEGRETWYKKPDYIRRHRAYKKSIFGLKHVKN